MKKIILSIALITGLSTNLIATEKKEINKPFFLQNYVEIQYNMSDMSNSIESKDGMGIKLNYNAFEWFNINTSFNTIDFINEDYRKTSYNTGVGFDLIYNLNKNLYILLEENIEYRASTYTVGNQDIEKSVFASTSIFSISFATPFLYNKIYTGFNDDLELIYGYQVGYEIIDNLMLGFDLEVHDYNSNFKLFTNFKF